MLKYVFALIVVVALIGGFFAVNARLYNEKQGGVEDYTAAAFDIDGQPVIIGSEGVAYFGNQAKGDLNDDTIPDLAFLITTQGGGSGTFYYAVATLQNSAGKYNGTNAIFLGDRIAPQTTEIRNGILIVNYADRKPGEPFTTQPSVGVSKYIYFTGTELIDVPPVGPITIQGTMVCLPHKDTEGPQTLECAFGLKDDSGRYFALSDTDPQYGNVAGAPMNERVEVKGNFKLRMGSKYQDIGVIEVMKITRLSSDDGSVGEFWGSAYGTVFLGPTCPVMRDPPDPECADKPYTTTLAVTSVDGARVIKQFQSDESGKFNVELPPGTYAIRSGAAAHVLPYCQSNDVFTIKANDSVEVSVSCDTGIR